MNRGVGKGPGAPARHVVVDLGGTWVRVTATGRPRRAFRDQSPGPAGLPRLLERLWRRWGLTRAEVAALGVASRGIWTAAERRALARRLRRFARRVVVISDVEAAHLAALGGEPGVLLLAGTGSIALGRDRRGRWRRAGGLGPLLGDDGSAFWIGREWLRDGGAAPGVARALGRDSDAVARIAARAPAVLRRARRGHARARRIERDAQRALARLVAAAARPLALRAPVPVSWAGGLLDDRRFRTGVWRQARGLGVAIAPIPPRAAAATPAAWASLL
ncbi:MAG TPA: BadF/BadG/BcrA/BcrD ATPase family protein [Candidatus Bathyarchaeia archaeon]|nr:BadF/BadG/BcrA/BcrD ATPase family protein [Candidatus Bathyarchaeia archaeon]